MAWDEQKYIGRNNAANGVSTSVVASNADGTVLERLEYIQVILGGFKGVAVTLAGQDGVTVTHNKGDLNYLCKIQPTGIGCLGRIGDISCIKAANTVVIYNSGHGGFLADVEITNINMA